MVETDASGVLNLLPVRNPALAGKLAMRGDLWRPYAEMAINNGASSSAVPADEDTDQGDQP